jgi:hypothetical protein
MSNSQVDLRSRLENAIDSATEEWDLTYYDVCGVLTVILHDLMNEARARKDKEASE